MKHKAYWVPMRPPGMPEDVYQRELQKEKARRYWEKHSRNGWWRFVGFFRGF